MTANLDPRLGVTDLVRVVDEAHRQPQDPTLYGFERVQPDRRPVQGSATQVSAPSLTAQRSTPLLDELEYLFPGIRCRFFVIRRMPVEE